MNSSQAKKASISLPASLERELKRVAKIEHRTLSGVIQEAARHYLSTRRLEGLQHDVALAAARRGIVDEGDVERAVHSARRTRS